MRFKRVLWASIFSIGILSLTVNFVQAAGTPSRISYHSPSPISPTSVPQGSTTQISVSGVFWANESTPKCPTPPDGTVPYASLVSEVLSLHYEVFDQNGADTGIGRDLNFNSDYYLTSPGVEVDCGQPYQDNYSAAPNSYNFNSFQIPVQTLAPGTYQIRFTGTITDCENINAPSNCNSIPIGDTSPSEYSFTVTGSPTCNIHVLSNVSTTWNIFGPANLNGSGIDTTYSGEPTGSYNISPATLSGYSGPTVSPSSTQDCTTNNTTTFTLTYTVVSTPTPTPVLPTVDIKAGGSNWSNSSDGPITISKNTSTTLYWTSSGADSCTASNGWSGSKAINNASPGESTGNLNSSTTYTITCSNGGGSASDSVTVNVSPPGSSPSVSLTVNGVKNLTVTSGTSVTLTWVTANATSCSASRSWLGSKNASGSSEATGALAQGTYTYDITCSGDKNPPASDSVTVTATSSTNNNPIGYLDIPGSNNDPNGCNLIGGWTFDPDSSSTDIQYQIYDGSTLISQGATNANRPDVNAAYGISGDHGFNITTPQSVKDGTAHTISVYGVDAQTGTPVQLTGSPRTITCAAPPIGYFESADCGTFGGWAFDPDNSSNPVVVHFYKDGPAGVGTFLTYTSTIYNRPDVNAAYGISGDHGFDTDTPASVKDATSHTIYAYAIDTQNPSTATLLTGSPKTISCGAPSDPTDVTYSAPNYCYSGPGGTINWTYNDPDNSPQTKYQIQITNTGNFNNPIYDSGAVSVSSTTAGIPTGVLQFNVTYKARVRTWNGYNNVSGWVETSSFKTPAYAYPQVGFTYSPTHPSKGSATQFTDQTVFNGNPNGRQWSWNFGDGGNSTVQNPSHTFSNASTYTVTETATDNANQTCSSSQTINVQKPIPVIKEVLPQ